MPQFVVINEQGPAWVPGRPMREQPLWTEHAAFIDDLAERGVIVFAGPLRGGPRHRALLVIRAADEAWLRSQLREDPWIRDGILREVEFYTWEVLVGKLPTERR